MGLTDPWNTPEPAPDEPAERGTRRQPEPEPAPDRAHAREALPQGAEQEVGDILAFPRGEPTDVAVRDDISGLATRARSLAAGWYADARKTGTAALDGSVYRSRPPALRDMHARITRAEWAGDIPALRIAGQVAGWIGLVLNAVLYTAAWITRRPLRWIVAALVTAIAVWGWPL